MMASNYYVTTVGIFSLSDCHGNINLDARVQAEQPTGADFPPEGMNPQGMGFFLHDVNDPFILDQTKLLQVGDSPFVMGPDNTNELNVSDDFVYVDGSRTFYASVIDTLPDGNGLGSADAVTPGLLERVRLGY